MTALRGRVADVRRSDDGGSALAIALVFLMIFGAYVGVVLQFATTGQRTTSTIRDEATNTYAGGGAIDGAINAIRGTLTQGTQTAGTTTCFTLPQGQLDNPAPVTVTCQPRAGSGASLGGGSASQPGEAVLALSTNTTEGVALGAGASVPVQGDVAVNKLLSVPATTTLTSTGSIKAGTCAITGTTAPACVVAAAPGDPGWTGPNTSTTALMGTSPGCGSLITLLPGIYRSAAALQSVLSCSNAVVWFKTGTYFFDFRDAGTHELAIGSGAVVVGGTALGWTPGTTPAASVPYPTAGSPTTSACDVTKPGVDLVFGGDSRLNVQGGRAQFCALRPSTDTTDQHMVLRGLASTASVNSSSAPAATTSASSNPPGAWSWDTPALGAVVDGATAHVTLPNTQKGPSILSLSGLGGAIVPADATSVSVTVIVTETVTGSGNTTLTLKPGSGSTPPTAMLKDCPAAAPCPGNAFDPTKSYPATFNGLSAAQVNGMSFDLTVNNPNNNPVDAWVDGITVSVSYSVPVQATSGTVAATPYVVGSATTTPLLRASGATTVLALHGTVYAPVAVVDLGLTNVPYTVIDRGLVVRHLQLSMTPASAGGPPLISIPVLGQQPRQVLMTTSTGARADVTLSDGAGANGSIPKVNEWSVS